MENVEYKLVVRDENGTMTPIEVLLQVDENGMTSAKKVYEFLWLNKAHYSRWSKTNITGNGFATEGEDYSPLKVSEGSKGNFAQDYKLTATFAKKLCMKAGGERGEQARDYFIKVEQRLVDTVKDKQSPIDMVSILQMTQQNANLLSMTVTAVNEEMISIKSRVLELEEKFQHPRQQVLELDKLYSVEEIAIELGLSSAKRLNKILHEEGVQYTRGGRWYLYKKYRTKGYARYKTSHLYWTPKGRQFIQELLRTEV